MLVHMDQYINDVRHWEYVRVTREISEDMWWAGFEMMWLDLGQEVTSSLGTASITVKL